MRVVDLKDTSFLTFPFKFRNRKLTRWFILPLTAREIIQTKVHHKQMTNICRHRCHATKPLQSPVQVPRPRAGSSGVSYGLYSSYLQENYKLVFKLFDEL